MHECVVQKSQSFYLLLLSLKFKRLWRPQCLIRAPAAPQQSVNIEVDHLQRLLEPHKRNFSNHFLLGLSPPLCSLLARNRTARLDSLPAPALLQGCLSRCLIGLESASLCPLTPLMLAGCFLLPPAAPPDRLTKPAGAARRSSLYGHSKPGRVATNTTDQSRPTEQADVWTRERGSHAEEIEDIVVFCCAVGAGDSLLLLLGDSVESKGRVSVLSCAFSVYMVCLRVRVFSSGTMRRWSVVISVLPCHSSGLCLAAAPMLRDLIKGLLVSVGRH